MAFATIIHPAPVQWQLGQQQETQTVIRNEVVGQEYDPRTGQIIPLYRETTYIQQLAWQLEGKGHELTRRPPTDGHWVRLRNGDTNASPRLMPRSEYTDKLMEGDARDAVRRAQIANQEARVLSAALALVSSKNGSDDDSAAAHAHQAVNGSVHQDHQDQRFVDHHHHGVPDQSEGPAVNDSTKPLPANNGVAMGSSIPPSEAQNGVKSSCQTTSAGSYSSAAPPHPEMAQFEPPLGSTKLADATMRQGSAQPGDSPEPNFGDVARTADQADFEAAETLFQLRDGVVSSAAAAAALPTPLYSPEGTLEHEAPECMTAVVALCTLKHDEDARAAVALVSMLQDARMPAYTPASGDETESEGIASEESESEAAAPAEQARDQQRPKHSHLQHSLPTPPPTALKRPRQ